MLAKRKKRLFRKPVSWPSGLAVVTLGLITLAACSPRSDYWSPVEAPKKNRVTWAEFNHPVRFAGASTNIGEDERDSMLRFLHRVAGGQGVRITLAAGSSGNARLALRRETALAEILRQNGYAPSLGESSKGKTIPANSVRVTVGRHVLTPPACPDWSKPAAVDPSNRVSSNFGCATETDLGLMVADPGVLLHGVDEVGPADGEAIAAGIKAYRENKVDKIETSSTLKSGK